MNPSTDRAGNRFAVLVAGIATLMVLAGIYILFQPVDSGDFESTTGVSWEGFAADNRDVADYLEREARLLGVAFAALGAVGVAVALGLLRKGVPQGWAIAWYIPAVLAGAAIVFFAGDGAALGSFYAVVAVIAGGVIWVGHRRSRRG